VIDFKNPYISLSVAEVFSLCVGAQYLSKRNTVKTIQSTPHAFQRIAAVLKKHCQCPEKGSREFFLPPMDGGESDKPYNN
jgi:hypothetical protein